MLVLLALTMGVLHLPQKYGQKLSANCCELLHCPALPSKQTDAAISYFVHCTGTSVVVVVTVVTVAVVTVVVVAVVTVVVTTFGSAVVVNSIWQVSHRNGQCIFLKSTLVAHNPLYLSRQISLLSGCVHATPASSVVTVVVVMVVAVVAVVVVSV
jgi:hypothetical protein